MTNEFKKQCGEGMYWCNTDKKCKPIQEGTARERFLQSLKRSGFDAKQKHKEWSDISKKMEQKNKEVQKQYSVKEDVPMNNAGGGAVAGIGVGPQGEPGIDKKKKRNLLTLMAFMRRKTNVAS